MSLSSVAMMIVEFLMVANFIFDAASWGLHRFISLASASGLENDATCFGSMLSLMAGSLLAVELDGGAWSSTPCSMLSKCNGDSTSSFCCLFLGELELELLVDESSARLPFTTVL